MINTLLIPLLMLTCHNIDTTTPLQDVLNRWLDGADMQTFNVLAQNWKKPGFISTNPCITFTIKSDVNLMAVFEETDFQKAVRLAEQWLNDN